MEPNNNKNCPTLHMNLSLLGESAGFDCHTLVFVNWTFFVFYAAV